MYSIGVHQHCHFDNDDCNVAPTHAAHGGGDGGGGGGSGADADGGVTQSVLLRKVLDFNCV